MRSVLIDNYSQWDIDPIYIHCSYTNFAEKSFSKEEFSLKILPCV